MKVVVITEPGKVEVIDKEKPFLRRGEALIKVKTCGLCTLEQRLYTGETKIFYPIVGGHEVAGVVEDLDKNIKSLKIGDRVVLDLINRCGECYYCRTGHSNLCSNKEKGNILGGLSEYIVLNPRYIFKIADNLSLEEATFVEPLSDCIHSLMRSRLSPEQNVFIIGAGTMGLLHLLTVKRFGMKAIVSDVNENRLNFAEKCGADFLIDASKENVPQKIKDFTNDVGSNIVIVTAPGKLPSIQAIQSVAKLGMVVFFASNYPSIKIPIDLSLLHYREITLTGSEGRTEKDFLKATYFLNSKAINVKPLISGKVDLTKIEEGFKRALDPSTYRIIVEFG